MPGIDNLDQTLPDRVRLLERKIDALMKGAPLRNASITEGGLRVGGNGWIKSTEWDGTGEDDPGTLGWALGGPGATAIFNTLVLRKGIIGNDALTSPLLVNAASGTSTQWGLPGSEAALVTKDVAVPAGFTKATALVTVTLSVLGTAGSGNSYIRARAGAVVGAATSCGTQSTSYLYDTDSITISASHAADFADLAPGSTVSLRGYGVALAGAKPAAASNTAALSAVLFFTR